MNESINQSIKMMKGYRCRWVAGRRLLLVAPECLVDVPTKYFSVCEWKVQSGKMFKFAKVVAGEK